MKDSELKLRLIGALYTPEGKKLPRADRDETYATLERFGVPRLSIEAIHGCWDSRVCLFCEVHDTVGEWTYSIFDTDNPKLGARPGQSRMFAYSVCNTCFDDVNQTLGEKGFTNMVETILFRKVKERFL